MNVDVIVGDLVGVYEAVYDDIPIIDLFYYCLIVGGDPAPHDYIDQVRWFPLSNVPDLAFDVVRKAIAALLAQTPVERRVEITLSRPQAIILFEMLWRFEERPDQLAFEDKAEEKVFWIIRGALESVLEEPLQPNYREIVDAARNEVRDVYNP